MLLSARCRKLIAYMYENCSYHDHSSLACGDAEWQREAIELKGLAPASPIRWTLAWRLGGAYWSAAPVSP